MRLEWQPIETAPEGEPVLLWREVPYQGDDWMIATKLGDGWLDDSDEKDQDWFTHWAPLPEPPQ